MRRLIVLSNPRQAQAFIDYMATRKVEVNMMPEGEGMFALWLSDESQLMWVEEELQQFMSDPYHQRYQAASWEVAETRRSSFRYATPSMMNMLKAKAGPVTLIIMLICGVVFFAQQMGLGRTVFGLLHFPAFEGQQLQLWRWFTHALLHFSVMHVAFNALWWWQLGGDVELQLGSRPLLKLFFVSAAVSGAAQYWAEGANFGGLSGVVYALVGYVWVLSNKAPQLGVHMPKPVFVFMIVWLVLGFIQPYMAIANAAHLAGLICGLAMGFVEKSRYQKGA
ncbi:rhomboid family intramembrane serine protease GlpG [Vibrio sp. WXL210]|uniref:rhomboid family intramembrane serine protease GlpG n=1 Tax=Vibrio sp. WXL210 TaxID=3450709 RepID=UPI003EC84B65